MLVSVVDAPPLMLIVRPGAVVSHRNELVISSEKLRAASAAVRSLRAYRSALAPPPGRPVAGLRPRRRPIWRPCAATTPPCVDAMS